MKDLEEDPDMRSRIALYKDPSQDARQQRPPDRNAMDMDDSDDEELEIPLAELLDDLERLEA